MRIYSIVQPRTSYRSTTETVYRKWKELAPRLITSERSPTPIFQSIYRPRPCLTLTSFPHLTHFRSSGLLEDLLRERNNWCQFDLG